MKPQKTQEQTELKEDSDSMEEVQNKEGVKKYFKYGGKEYSEDDYDILEPLITNEDDVAQLNEDICNKLLEYWQGHIKNTTIGIKEARLKGRDTSTYYQTKLNLEPKIQMVQQRLTQICNKPQKKDNYKKNLEKAKLLTRQGIVNIRPETVEYAEIIKRNKF